MRFLARLVAGGLVVFAVVLYLIANPAWVAHAIGAAVALLAIGIDGLSRRQGRASWVWNLLAVVAFVGVYWAVWL
ncbi:hypothetical protein F7230_02345 [Corynebacterium sp. 320]|uniref:Uncharacterized protein n=1 Tax=Corynebacterium zhongnanshanii TaxID=2768834 RepID=A0ABQ6VFJ9_9CORY|nr:MULTISPECIES: hypothetical protein [Corynebacterium]KAB1503966.1 hypothetical protein F7230_02345 [Corynebacterium sp. 320]KAB1552935.1 hypothetical protein F7233_04250 [Corynebacterium sp. 321]KAB1553845.1 hypothetical protein F7232_02330 [Corynebacterium sp. 319]KAB3523185.1 hypothetical protein F8377_03310 [Corynebacterium zhongnanshanii]KAB3528102.1 hypothetical protein F8354_02345 [Corynebacterium sp. 250]